MQNRLVVASAMLLAALSAATARAEGGTSAGATPVAPASSNIDLSALGSTADDSPLSDAAAKPSADLELPAPPPSTGAATSTQGKSLVGIAIPAPPPPSAFGNNSSQVAVQAEQAAIQAETQAEAEKRKRDEEANRKSFERAAGGLLPMSPEQIREFMKRVEQTDLAAVPPSAGIPKLESRITTLSLDPGSALPDIHLQAGYVTTINVMDATGEPWPILDAGIGGNFEVSPTKAGTHIVRVMPLSSTADGNLSILMQDLPTPVIFHLTTGGANMDMRYDVRVPKMGPKAKMPLIDRPRLEAGNETLMMLLQNAPPASAKKLKLSGLDQRSMAWAVNDHVFLRTPLSLLSPAWDASVSSDDGMTVYEIGDAPVLLMSDNGAMVRARILRDDSHD